METLQRNALPAIPPWTRDWSRQRRLGFGVVAFIPLVLLCATFLAFALATAGVGGPRMGDSYALLFYVHVGAQFITILIFGHLMIGNPMLASGTKLLWGLGFLFMAPFAIVTYWLVHVWRSEPQLPSEAQPLGPHDRQVHVYDFDYADHRARGTVRREDGVIVHHVDASPT